MAVGLVAVFAVGAFLIGWQVAMADRGMRADLLKQVWQVANAMSREQVQALTGTEADRNTPQYRLLKDKLTAVRAGKPHCRFVYLLGRTTARPAAAAPAVGRERFFFFVDSETPGSKDYSPPGQLFAEPTAELRRVFDDQAATVEGPVSDRWGVWISALVPLADPHTGALLAVLGMDVDARDWSWAVASHAALPVGMILLLLIGVAAILVADRSDKNTSADASPKPVMRRLLLPLATLCLLLLLFTWALLYHQYRRYLNSEITADVNDIANDVRGVLTEQTADLALTLGSMAADASVQRALREGSADSLLAAWRPFFEKQRQERYLTHFYFLDARRVCLLRVHKPEMRGDLINRFTAQEAERTGKTAAGLELGPLGTITLRVVQPVFDGGARVGYVELGKEIADTLRAIHLRSDVQLAVVLRKKHLDRKLWEDGMRLLGRTGDWDRLPRSVVSYSSQDRLSDAFLPVADLFADYHQHGETEREIACDEKKWRVTATPLQDASGQEVGDLLVMRDLSAEASDFARLMALNGTSGVVLLALLLSVIYVLLRRTDAGIRAQQAALRMSEERFDQLAEQSGTLVWEVDAQGRFTYVSHVAEAVLGFRPEEMVGRMCFYDLHPEAGREAFKQAAFAAFERKEPFRNLVNLAQTKAGGRVWLSTNGQPLLNAGGSLRGYRGSDTDITERKRTEEALSQSAESLRAMAVRLQGAREDERSALSRELHDNLGQHLTAFSLQFELLCMDNRLLSAQPADLAALYDSLVSMVPLVERMTEQTHALCASLRPTVLDELGLVAALEWLVQETKKNTDLLCVTSLPAGEIELDRDVALALYRIVQESLANVACHAQATRVEVRLHRAGSAWELEIQDNGQGFAPGACEGVKAIGLLSIRERAGVFGGTVDFLSEPGKGATVRVRMPGGKRAIVIGERI
jgi:PAS domain S-box-containing protein